MVAPEVVVWAADGKPLPFLSYGARVAALLRRAGGHVRVVPYRRRALTPTELAAPVHVLSGGETSSFATDEVTLRALTDLRTVLERAWRGEATVLGICLGSQLIARAIDPTLPISYPDGGMEAGLCTVEQTDGFGALRVAELHYEQIDPSFATVPGVTVTHTNAHSPVQGFRWGDSVFGYQFHPEWDVADAAQVLRRHIGLVAERCADPAAAFASVDPDVTVLGGPAWSPWTAEELLAEPALAQLGLRPAAA
ncbi:hypothetical protein OEB99_00050 [Actinotalea sp. M2MS4P-6]|uniref:glutamine amidotransferase-related protein n=1 Tax=Actinotalea sp. M2MS4P-6 TaxID=2983762 RepID=UPI0021E3DF8B|nr:hypothetical protein [Actinotalea sp. M2MS4P-6]MCV2392688.1 hypothetical protein [Actinotalea sp. M2MS4P-6]